MSHLVISLKIALYRVSQLARGAGKAGSVPQALVSHTHSLALFSRSLYVGHLPHAPAFSAHTAPSSHPRAER